MGTEFTENLEARTGNGSFIPTRKAFLAGIEKACSVHATIDTMMQQPRSPFNLEASNQTTPASYAHHYRSSLHSLGGMRSEVVRHVCFRAARESCTHTHASTVVNGQQLL